MNRKSLSLLLSVLWLSSCAYSSLGTFDDIAEVIFTEVIFTYQLTIQRPSQRKHLIFMSVNAREDPSSALLERLNRRGFRVRAISQSRWNEGKLQDKATGEVGLWLSVYDVGLTSPDNCKSKGAIQSDRDNLLGWKYQLIKKFGKWKVTDVELYLES